MNIILVLLIAIAIQTNVSLKICVKAIIYKCVIMISIGLMCNERNVKNMCELNLKYIVTEIFGFWVIAKITITIYYKWKIYWIF